VNTLLALGASSSACLLPSLIVEKSPVLYDETSAAAAVSLEVLVSEIFELI